MIRVFKFLFCVAVAACWLFIAYLIIDWIGEQIEFSRAMGGLF